MRRTYDDVAEAVEKQWDSITWRHYARILFDLEVAQVELELLRWKTRALEAEQKLCELGPHPGEGGE